MMATYTIEEISRVVDGSLVGSRELRISGLEQITEAVESQLTFIGEKKYAKLWERSNASAALVNDTIDLEPGDGRALVRVTDADLALVKVLKMFAAEPPLSNPGIHSQAIVDETAQVGEGASIGAGCYIGPGVVIGENTRIYPNVTVLDHTKIGDDTVIWPGVVIRERCRIGSRCIIQPNATIGSDGFGIRPSPDGKGLIGLPHIGTVEIGDDVEIGAGTCVDRGKFSATSVGAGTKIDNLVQIAHNCRIGRSCIIAGQTGIGGTVTLGDGVVMGGASRVRDHVTIGDRVTLGGGTGVVHDVPAGQTLLGAPADHYRRTLKLWAAQKKLPDLIRNRMK